MTQTGDGVEDVSYSIWIGTICTIIPATIAVFLRFVSRYVARAGYWWDDWAIAISLVVNWGMGIIRWLQILIYSTGKHTKDISRQDHIGYQKTFLAVQMTYFANAVLTKSSFLLLYQRIFGVVRGFRWALWISWFLILSYFVICVVTAIAGCSPVSHFWDQSRPGSCFDELQFFRSNGIVNMLLDVLILCLPIPMVWRIKTSRRTKVFLTGIFLLGGFVCVVSLFRILSFDETNRTDPTYGAVDTSMWSSVEQSVGIVCACLPTFRPLKRLCRSRQNASNTEDSVSKPRPHTPLDSRLETRLEDPESDNMTETRQLTLGRTQSLPPAMHGVPSFFSPSEDIDKFGGRDTQSSVPEDDNNGREGIGV